MATKTTFCRICESLCGLEVEVESNQVISIKPDSNHVTTHGFACPKGLYQHELYASPDRLTMPQKKVGGSFQDAEWDEVLPEIGSKIRSIVDQHGANSVAMYVGTAAGFGVLHPIFAQGFMTGIGSGSMYASATQDCANKFAVAQRMYGFPFTLPFPDVARTQCLIIVGANPMVSKWSFLQVVNPRRQINEIKSRGGRVVVIDPRHTETAKAAGEHHFIRPGTDLYFYLAFLNELIKQDGVDTGRVERYMSQFEEVAELCRPFTAKATSQITGIPAKNLKELVALYLASDGASLYCSTGVNMSEQGTMAYWIQEVINAVSGNLDKAGGALVGKGIIDFAKFGKKHNLLVKADRSRIGGFGKTNDAFPGGILADEILTPGEGQVKALIVTGGNPLMTMADANKLKEAFGELELLVSLDIQPSETAVAGHYILPCTSPLERPDLPFIFPLMLGLQTRPYLQATDAILSPPGEARDEATIYMDLAKYSGKALFGSGVFQKTMEFSRWWTNRRAHKDQFSWLTKAPRGIAQQWLLSVLLRLCGQPSFKRLLREQHGWLRPDHVAGSFLGKRVYTTSKRIELAPLDLLARAQAWADSVKPTLGANPVHSGRNLQGKRESYQLITKRTVTTHNSWTHNYAPFVKGERDRNYIYMHSVDMQEEQLVENQFVEISGRGGSITLQVSCLDDLMPGVVSIPHGWGHDDSGLSIARTSGGANVNVLHASGPETVDDISGMSTLTGVPVQIKKVANG